MLPDDGTTTTSSLPEKDGRPPDYGWSDARNPVLIGSIKLLAICGLTILWISFGSLKVYLYYDIQDQARQTLMLLAQSNAEYARALADTGRSVSELVDDGPIADGHPDAAHDHLLIADFRATLHAPEGVVLRLQDPETFYRSTGRMHSGATGDFISAGDLLTAFAIVPGRQIVSSAEWSRSQSLKEWRDEILLESSSLAVLTAFLVVLITLLVRQLRRQAATEIALGIAKDTATNRRQESLSAQLRQAQKMEALGQVAGGITHDFNNLLMIIDSYAQRHKDRMRTVESMSESLEEIHRACGRASGLTRQLLAFSRKHPLETRVIRIGSVLDDLPSFIGPLIGAGISLSIRPDAKDRLIDVDSSLLSQAILNLAVNARDAMPNGGELTVFISTETVAFERRFMDQTIAPGGYTVINVRDTGSGIPEHVLEHIFEPFFSTKSEGKGTGLGLAMVFGFATQAGGYVSVVSKPGTGSEFSIHLPIVEGVATEEDDVSAGDMAGRGEMVLLVEDEDALQRLLRSTLEMRGYRVTTASTGVEGLEADIELNGAIDIVVTDADMPHMGGLEMSQILREDRPDLKVVLISGQPAPSLLEHTEALKGLEFIQKPFPVEKLLRLIRVTLDGGPQLQQQ